MQSLEREKFCLFDSSEARAEPHSNGSERFVGPLRQAEVNPGFGQREEENKDNQGLLKPRMERDNHFVSGVLSYEVCRCAYDRCSRCSL